MEQREMLTVHIRRCPADGQSESSLATYQVPFAQGMSIMDALRYIQEHVDSTLAFDCSCRIGICGTCAVRVDGKVMMACSTVVKDGIHIEPVSSSKAQRDLIVRSDSLPASVSDILAKHAPCLGE